MQRADGSLFLAGRHGREIETYHVSQGDTNDCGPHVVTVAVNFWHGRALLEGGAVAQEMNRPRFGWGFPPLVVRRIPNWATFPWGIADVLRAHGLKARWRLWAHEEHLHRALRENHIAMPIFGEPLRRRGWRWTGWSHVAILIGFDPASETYFLVDTSHRLAPTETPRDEFLRRWRNMGRILVEAF